MPDTDTKNLERWAVTQGYNPSTVYPEINPVVPPIVERPVRPPIGDAPVLPEGYVSPHFRAAEFYCNHCGKPHPTKPTPPKVVLGWLELGRAHFGGKPVNVNSGYRCPHWNDQVGGAASSLHLEGQAVDHWIKNVSTADMYWFYDDLIGSLGGVGYYPGFVHIDNRGYRARWGNPPSKR